MENSALRHVLFSSPSPRAGALPAPRLNARLTPEAAGLSAHDRRVLDSPELRHVPSSFRALNGASSELPPTATARQRRARVRERETDPPHERGGSDAKMSKTASSRLTHPAAAVDSRPLDAFLTIPTGIPFYISARDLPALQAASPRPLEITGSGSDGSAFVRFADAPVEAPLQVPEPREGDAACSAGRAGEPEAGAAQAASEPGYEPFDPVNSAMANRLCVKLNRMLDKNAPDTAIYEQLFRPKGHLRQHLRHNRQAFTPELLVVVLRTLSTLDNDAAIKRLGNAFGRLRVFARHGPATQFVGSGTLGHAARQVIGDALGHESVQASVPLRRLLKFLEAANETAKPKSLKRETGYVNGGPRSQFTTAGTRHGIPQALAQRLVREAAAAASGDLTGVLASASQLGQVLSKETQHRYEQTQDAVFSEIQRSGLAQAVKAQLKDAFNAGFEFGPDESADESPENA